MKIFEFQFNPKARNDRFFRVFSFHAPPEMPEKGNMYIVGELQNALLSNATFLDRLAGFLQQDYYEPEKPMQSAFQKLKNVLKKGNTFLAEETKNGNVDWIGNLRLLLLLFIPSPRGQTLYFTKVGAMKLWIARAGSLVDAGKSIEFAKKDEGSTKIFGNVGSGNVIPGDRIIALTADAFDFFSKENFLQTIAQLKEDKQFKNIFKSKQKEMSSLSGVLLFMSVEASEGSHPAFPLAQLKMPKIPMPKVSFPDLSLLKKKFPSFMVSETRKRIGLLALLLLVLFLGFAILGTSSPDGSTDGVNGTGGLEQEEISEEFRILHKITEIKEPEVAAELTPTLVAENPQRMIHLEGRFYFFGPSSSNISMFDSTTNTSEIFSVGKNLAFGTSFGDSLLFFAEPDTIMMVDRQNTVVQHTLAFLPADLYLGAMEQFAGNLYLFDSRTGEIFKSSIPSAPSAEQVALERWFDPLSSKKPINARTMGIDGNIWILTVENEIQRYFRGRYQESLNLEVFPQLQEATLLKTSSQLPNLYILEPEQGRIVILSKSGQALQQYRSSAFRQVRDFAVSPDGQTIYLFDGVKVYRISPITVEST